MPINPKRIAQDIETIAAFNESKPAIGFSRPTFFKSWRSARDYVMAQADAAGCKTRIDAFGNVHARPRKLDWGGHVWLSGSHIDSVPTGGKFDGVVGVVCPLEVLRVAHEAGQIVPLELIIFAEEEGTTFGLGMIGSRLWTGDATADSIQSFNNSNGLNYLQAGDAHGVKPGNFSVDRFNPSHYRGLVEIHIEQGPALWEQRAPVAVVAAISGRQQYMVELKGVANHAGSTPMNHRCDALVMAARIILDLERMAGELSDHTVATVGRIECHPNAINVIPGQVRFTIDLRSPSADDLFDGHNLIEQLIRNSAAREASFTKTEEQPVVEMNAPLVARLSRLAGDKIPTVVSGALHDAAILAPHLPTAMLFIPSREGISHNPAEFSRIEDIVAATQLLGRLIDKV